MPEIENLILMKNLSLMIIHDKTQNVLENISQFGTDKKKVVTSKKNYH
jgi:hypothetical protein